MSTRDGSHDDALSGITVSPDGKELAVIEENAPTLLSAGTSQPKTVTALTSTLSTTAVAFNAASDLLAAGESLLPSSRVLTEVWRAGQRRPLVVTDCGGGIAWTYNPDIFACQNSTGAHLRSIRDPQKDIGAAGPVSDLPILKVGNSLWVAAYKTTDWKDPGKPLPLTLVELGTGKRVTVTLPGR